MLYVSHLLLTLILNEWLIKTFPKQKICSMDSRWFILRLIFVEICLNMNIILLCTRIDTGHLNTSRSSSINFRDICTSLAVDTSFSWKCLSTLEVILHLFHSVLHSLFILWNNRVLTSLVFFYFTLDTSKKSRTNYVKPHDRLLVHCLRRLEVPLSILQILLPLVCLS